MSLFGEQLQTRLENDKRAVDTNERLLGTALGGRRTANAHTDAATGSVAQQMRLIARYFRIEQPDIPKHCKDTNSVVQEALKITNMSKRGVRLTGAWWKDSDGPLLAMLRDGEGALALFPGAFSGLYFIDATTGKRTRVTRKNAATSCRASCSIPTFLLLLRPTCVSTNSRHSLLMVTTSRC